MTDPVGLIFERLTYAQARHKHGRYFTPLDVVDLINAFCIRKADAVVFDPAVGAGAFLARAYVRKKTMDSSLTHKELLGQLWGIDIDKSATRLAAINLAARSLADRDNHPMIARSDFFDVKLLKPVFEQPMQAESRLEAQGASLRKTFYSVPKVDAAVGNLPYVRHELIEDKEKLREVIASDFPGRLPKLSGRSDLHVYFWPHITPFLVEGGYVGFLSSNSWLDVDYGAGLQSFIFENYRIVAILESKMERWFEQAAVNTVITVLKKCSDASKRDSNMVRFVQIKKLLREMIPQTENELVRQRTLDRIVRQIEDATEYTEDATRRVHPVRQGELYAEGTDKEGRYIGTKWGRYLRAPEVFFEILERGKDKLCVLSDVADVRFGIKTGANAFFYLADEDARAWGIEAEYLKSVIKSPRESDNIILESARLNHKALMVHESKATLKGTNMLKYIREGERQRIHERVTCRSRALWYDLGQQSLGEVLWPMIHNERNVAFLNPEGVLADHNLFEICPLQGARPRLLCAVLNSSVTALVKEVYGRVNLGEGGLKTEGVDIKKFLVLDLRKAGKRMTERLERTFDKLCRRPVLTVFEEIKQPDRWEFDNVILEVLGFRDAPKREKVQEKLYQAVVDLVQTRRRKAQSVEEER